MQNVDVNNHTSPKAVMHSILTPHGLRSGADLLACATVQEQAKFLDDIGEGGLCALPFLFEFWAMPGRRGAGKTRAGAEWVRSKVEGARPFDPGACTRVALVGETQDQVREVMIFGDSGIMACSPPDRRPKWVSTRKRLEWPNGAVATVHSAHDYEGLRGPQFDAAWVDELAKWKKSEEAWDQLQFALRLGDQPQVCVTTTPRNVGVLKALLDAPSTVTSHAPTEANRANLAQSFLQEVRDAVGAAGAGRCAAGGCGGRAVDLGGAE